MILAFAPAGQHKTRSRRLQPKVRRHTAKKRSAPAPTVPTSLAQTLAQERREKVRYDKPDEAAAYFRLKRLPAGEQRLPMNKYLSAQAQMDAMPQYAAASNRYLPARQAMKRTAQVEALSSWAFLGPGNVGGRTRALLIHPTTPNVMYAAGVAGGVWRTTNGGQSWEPLTDLLANLGVACLAFDPKNPQTIYAGTGEGFFNQDSLQGAGIFRTTDGGNTWQQLAATNTADFYYVNDFVVSPHNSQVLYAATDTGVWRSTDAGQSWTRTQAAREEEIGGCLDLAIRTDQPTDVLFAVFGMFQGGAIYRNLDASADGAWEVVSKQETMWRAALAIAPSDQNVIYAVVAGDTRLEQNGLQAVLRSTSGGAAGSWTVQGAGNDPNPLNRRILANPIIAFLGECGFGRSELYSQSWYDLAIAVDPADANRVWVGGTDLFRSDDGGKNWGQASHWWAEKDVPQYSHADHHSIIFHPGYNGTTNKTLFVTNDGGIFRTDDARAGVATGPLAVCNPSNSKVTWTALNNNYGVTQFYHGLPFPDGKSYFGGTQDNGTLLGTDATGVNRWREINGGDGGYVAVDYLHPNILYAEYTGLSLRKSTDGGATFSSAMGGFDYFLGGDGGLFITPFTMDPSNPRVLYTGGIAIWRTMDAGAHWFIVGDSVGTGSGRVSAIAVAPTDSNYVLVGKSTGLVHRTQRALAIQTSTPVFNNADPDWQVGYFLFHNGGFISSLAFDPADKNIAYATVSTFGVKHVWKSLDAGATWSAIDGEGNTGLPDVPAHCIAIDPNNAARLFVGTDLGVFASTDGGATWAVENNGFANTIVESLAIQTVQGTSYLYAFTHGRGAWRVPLGAVNCERPEFAPVKNFTAAGGEGVVQITNAARSCSITASTSADWIQILSTTAGEVRYQVKPQTQYKARTGTITIGTRSHQVTQAVPPDTTPPKITITSPASGLVTNAGIVKVTYTVTDDDKVSFLQAGKDCQPFYIDPTMNVLPNHESYFELEPGINTFCILVSDPAGNRSTASIQITSLPEYYVTTIAGVTGGQGYDGDGKPARQTSFYGPQNVSLDSAGNLYIADRGNGRVRKLDAKTNRVTTVAGKGYPNGAFSSGDGGPALDAVLAGPQDARVDQAGNLYILESARIRKVTPDGIINTIAGTGEAGYGGDGGPGTSARIANCYELTLDASGNVYFADSGNNRIRKIDARTGFITTVVGTGVAGYSGDGGLATQAQIKFPLAVAFDRSSNLYFTDSNNYVRKVLRDTGIISTIAGNGQYSACEDFLVPENVPALSASLYGMGGLEIDAAGNIYVAAQCRLRRISPDGFVTTVAGLGQYFPSMTENIPALREVTRYIHAIDASGTIYYAEEWANAIRKIYPVKFKPGTVTVQFTSPTAADRYTTTEPQIALSGTAISTADVLRVRWHNDRGGTGMATGTANWTIPEIALYSGVNRITVTAETIAGDGGEATLTVNVTPAYVAHRLAGRGTHPADFSGDGARALDATFAAPTSVAVDNAGNVYIADRNNYRIRKVATDGTISTYAGTGEVGSGGDGGLAVNAELNQPMGVTCDAAGNLFIADTLNHRIRKVTPTGSISTYAGTGRDDFGGDGGPATAAWLNSPRGLAVDEKGNLFIADTGNHRIRKVDARTGIMTTIAGTGNPIFSGEGGLATAVSLNVPADVAVDRQGNVYIADRGNKRVRKVAPDGYITTVLDESSTNTSGTGAFNPLASYAGVKTDSAGNVYVTNELYPQITRLTPDGEATIIAGGTSIFPIQDGSPALGIRMQRPIGLALDRVGNVYVADPGAGNVWVISPYQQAAAVNGASYTPNAAVGMESIVSLFGVNLATQEAAAQQLPLPLQLAGTSVKVRDSLGVERLAPLFYVSKLQVNYQIPVGTAAGMATILVTTASGAISSGSVDVKSTSPGLFAAAANGSGWAAANVLYVKGEQRWSGQTASCTAQGCSPTVIDVSSADETYLELYGTGVRFHTGLANVRAVIGGESVPVLYAGPQCCYAGVDQINLKIPRSLQGRGEVDIVLIADEKIANTVKIKVK
ncbi:MAG: hypothetical protein U0Y68_16345 [Blastocatellia bacterium]